MVRGKHTKTSRDIAGRGTHVKAPERRMVTAIGYPLAFAALCALACGPGYAMATEAASGSSGEGPSSDSAAIVSNQTSNAPVASSKDETVYVFAKADGSVKNVEVSDKLTNAGKSSELADSSTLTNIENVEGDESHRGSGDSIVWDAQGSDIYYRGDSDAELPISMSVTYKLDGRTVSAGDLAGKSGKVEIAYSFKNNTKAEGDVQVPFTAITGMLFSNDNFSDIEIDNGRVIDDGDRVVVVGYAMPGLADSLDVGSDTIDIPDGFTVTAQATDFELNSTLTMVTGSLFDSVNMDDLDTGELADSSSSLKDAMSQLISGSGELSDGLRELADGSSALSDGLGSLDEGAGNLSDGISALADGAGSAAGAAGKLASGAESLASGASSLADGTEQMGEQTAALPDGVKQLSNGADSLANGLDSAVDAAGQLASGASTLSSGLNSAVAGTDRLISGADQLSGGLNQLVGDGSGSNPGLTAVKDGADSLAASLSDTKEQLSTLNGQLSTASSGAQEIADGAETANTSIDGIIELVNASDASEPDKATIADYLRRLKEGNAAIADGATAIKTEADYGVSQLTPAVVDGGGLDQMITGANALSSGTQSAIDAIQSSISAGVTSLRGGLTTLKSGDGTLSNTGLEGAASGSAQLASGASQLKGDTTSGLTSAKNGADQLSEGLSSLRDKVPELVKGVNKIVKGSDSLKDGSITLSKSLAKFDEALDGLSDGAGAAAEGAEALAVGAHDARDGSSSLADGAASAADGSLSLLDGLVQFDEEGISKIIDLIDNDLMGAVDRVDAVKAAGEKYDNFSGITEGTKGTVKFVIETDAVEADD